MASKKIFTAVFSYNRPLHLENCLQSLKDMYPDAHVVVFDDNSPNVAVDEVIQKFDCEVRKGKGGSGRHGGLYDNMQMAYEEAIEGGYDYLLALQDDMQIVRPVDGKILMQFDEAFALDPSIASLEPRFAKGQRQAINPPPGPAPLTAEPSAFRDYLDVSLLHIGRLAEKKWSFHLDRHYLVSGEQTLSIRASEMGLRRYRFATPFTMHVPFPHLYRNRLRLPRLSGLRGRIFRYEYMSQSDIECMDNRPKDEPAYWREHLKVEDANWFDRLLLSSKNDAKVLA